MRNLLTAENTDIHNLNKILKYLSLKKKNRWEKTEQSLHDEWSDHTLNNLRHSNQILSSFSDHSLNINTTALIQTKDKQSYWSWIRFIQRFVLFGPQQCGANMVQWGKNILRTDKHPVQRTVKGWGHAVNSRIKRVFVLVPIKYST